MALRASLSTESASARHSSFVPPPPREDPIPPLRKQLAREIVALTDLSTRAGGGSSCNVATALERIALLLDHQYADAALLSVTEAVVHEWKLTDHVALQLEAHAAAGRNVPRLHAMHW